MEKVRKIDYEANVIKGLTVEPLMMVKDLCTYFRVTRGTVSKWRKAGIPEIDIAGNPRFKRTEVQEWLQDKKL